MMKLNHVEDAVYCYSVTILVQCVVGCRFIRMYRHEKFVLEVKRDPTDELCQSVDYYALFCGLREHRESFMKVVFPPLHQTPRWCV